MIDMRIDCQVDVPVEQLGGDYADAFRVQVLPNGECVLEFMVLSSCQTQILLVTRIRVDQKFLESIRDRLESTLKEIQLDYKNESVEDCRNLNWFVTSSTEKVN